MTNATANTDAAIQMIAKLREDADELRARLSVQTLTSHGYIVTRDGDAMNVRRYQDGTWATMCLSTRASRWTKEDAVTLAAAFGEESEGEWRAEYWRDVAARDLDVLVDMIARFEARFA